MERELTDHMLACAAAFSAARSYELTTLGRLVCGDTTFFSRLRDPKATFTARKYDEVMAWFSSNWPDGVRWPKGVPRPAIEKATAG